MIDYLAANLWAMWLALSVVLLIVELCSGGFFIMCFSVGAVCSAIVAPFAGIYVQLGVFILILALSVVMVRPLALKYLHRHDDVRVSNADAIIGRTGTVSQVIPVGGYGRVALDGDDWKACSSDTEELPAGTMVKIIDRESVIVKVTKLK